MKIDKIKLKNFRCYKDSSIDTNNNMLTAFVGENDAGKSTILEALDIFFNDGKGVVKMDDGDFYNNDSSNTIEISLTFTDYPTEVTIDDTNKTSLKSEYLLSSEEKLEIVKKYEYGKTNKPNVFIRAQHPTNKECSDLLEKTISDLKNKVKSLKISNDGINKTKSADLRKAIWEHYEQENLSLQEVDIEIKKEGAKNIWEKIEECLPMYALFQSDRKNNDQDEEAQGPLSIAIKKILNEDEIKNNLGALAKKLLEKLGEISSETHEMLREIDSNVAKELVFDFPDPKNLKWDTIFKKMKIIDEKNIPINKRGSGVKRLILLSFFKAEAKRQAGNKNIIYAFEEPETSQHPQYQRVLIETFDKLSKNGTQIFLTTHSPAVVKHLKCENILVLQRNNIINIINSNDKVLPTISLNEINYIAFKHIDTEYHNELYGYLEYESCLDGFKNQCKCKCNTKNYKKDNNGKPNEPKNISLSEYIRHQIHHPENQHNERYTQNELNTSIKLMREYLLNRNK